ncbi:MAG TPA: acetylglutamate kinase [Clostridia bacterium]|nr:acetylglutamate kinase [Clostridia bacterium]
MGKMALNLNNRVRMLWMQHSEWTRMAFTSVIFNNAEERQVVQRLLRNPIDFACFLASFYGEGIGGRFGVLLTEHLSLAVALVRATIAQDTGNAEKIKTKLFHNAEEISAFLASINPYWHYEIWKEMFFIHLDLAIEMAGQQINGEYEESINTYDRFEAEVMEMARMMFQGIMKQFACAH